MAEGTATPEDLDVLARYNAWTDAEMIVLTDRLDKEKAGVLTRPSPSIEILEAST